jgi:hypothetical protein
MTISQLTSDIWSSATTALTAPTPDLTPVSTGSDTSSSSGTTSTDGSNATSGSADLFQTLAEGLQAG